MNRRDKKQVVRLNESQVRQIVMESVRKVMEESLLINESLKSKKLAKIAKENGGFETIKINGRRYGVRSGSLNQRDFKFYASQITDGMLGNLYDSVDEIPTGVYSNLDYFGWVGFNNGKVLALFNYDDIDSDEYSRLFRRDRKFSQDTGNHNHDSDIGGYDKNDPLIKNKNSREFRSQIRKFVKMYPSTAKSFRHLGMLY